MGRYYPPDATNPPVFNQNSHPLGARASKITQGILTVRFELPFAVWCAHCKPNAIVGQGVRFNAEKKKVGNYYSTPIWSFRMKHTACGGWWEIRTDPAKSEYVVFEGARRRDYGSGDKGAEGEEGGDLRFLTEEEREKRREDAFANLEGKKQEKVLEKGNKKRVEELYEMSEVWRDPYDVNARLRQTMRGVRKVVKREERVKEGIQEKFSLGMEIADEVEADRRRAKLIDFGPDGDKTDNVWKPLFAEEKPVKASESTGKSKKLKSEIAAERSRKDLQHALVGNTRAVIDPFLSKECFTPPRVNLGLLKRKRDVEQDKPSTVKQSAPSEKPVQARKTKKPAPALALVDYDSD